MNPPPFENLTIVHEAYILTNSPSSNVVTHSRFNLLLYDKNLEEGTRVQREVQ